MHNTATEDDFLAGGGTPLKFESLGAVHSGKLVSIKSRPDTDPAGNVKKWEDGTPKKVYLWELENDEGELGTLWVRGNLVTVLRDASRAAGAKTQTDLIGAKVQVKHHALGEPSQKGFAPPKLFQAKITLAPKPEPSDAYDPFE